MPRYNPYIAGEYNHLNTANHQSQWVIATLQNVSAHSVAHWWLVIVEAYSQVSSSLLERFLKVVNCLQ